MNGNNGNNVMKWRFSFITALIVLGVLYIPAKAQGYEYKTFTVRPNTLGCENLEDYKRLSNLAGDLQAFDKLMKLYILSGACRWLPVGKEAIVERYGVLDSTAKVRVKGETQSFWIPQKSME